MAVSTNPYDDSYRYGIRASYQKDSKLSKSQEEHFHNSTRELFPNCVRIEPLSAEARRSYLAGVAGIYDSVKYAFLEQLSPEAFKPFYGIINSNEQSKLQLSFSSSWGDKKGDYEAIVDNMSHNPLFASALGGTVASTIAGDAGMAVGSAVGGVLTAFSNGIDSGSSKSSIVSSPLKTMSNKLSDFNTALNRSVGRSDSGGDDMYGLDSTSVGSSTMRNYTGSDFDFNKQLHFEWYMPEQEDLCRLSIRRLLKLAYVRSLNDNKESFGNRLKKATAAAQKAAYTGLGDLGSNVNALSQNIESTANEAATYAQANANALSSAGGAFESVGAAELGTANTISTAFNAGTSEVSQYLDNAGSISDSLKKSNSYGSADADNLMNASSNLISSFLNTMVSADNYIFGREAVGIPFPLRLTVGNIIDIEPVVITNVSITPSSELFINRIGAHIPVTISADVSFKSWMTPSPDSEFLSFLGDNIFKTCISSK